MCDSLCSIGGQGTVFAKNSDRPIGEVQLVRYVPGRQRGSEIRTQYLSIPDVGAGAVVLAQPTWLWGAEHGVNEHGVAIGNERITTVHDAASAPNALIGMDLVRLGLERGSTATGALDAITELLNRHGQGGMADAIHHEAYFSSFLIADPTSAWVLETSGSTWAAEPVQSQAAISNRVSLESKWTRSSPDVALGANFDEWRNRREQTGFADIRLEASRRFLRENRPADLTPRQMVAHLRDHGAGPWGAPGERDRPSPLPGALQEDFTGVSVCMHVRDISVTTSSMVCWLPRDDSAFARSWMALGSPCVSVYVPVLPPEPGRRGVVPDVLSDESLWRGIDVLRGRAEESSEFLDQVREVLDPIEDELWAEADNVSEDPRHWVGAAERWGKRLTAAVAFLQER